MQGLKGHEDPEGKVIKRVYFTEKKRWYIAKDEFG